MYTCSQAPIVGECITSYSFTEAAGGCDAGFFLQGFKFLLDSNQKLYTVNKCCVVDDTAISKRVNQRKIKDIPGIIQKRQDQNLTDLMKDPSNSTVLRL